MIYSFGRNSRRFSSLCQQIVYISTFIKSNVDIKFTTAELKRRGMHPNHKGGYFDAPAEHPAEYAMWGSDVLLQRLSSYHKKGENIGYMGEKRKRLVVDVGYDAKNASHAIRLLRNVS